MPPSFSIIVKNEIIESTSTYIDSLLPGKTYYARVKAVNDFEFNGTYAHPIKFYAEGLQTSNSDGFVVLKLLFFQIL
ncbi:MAG: fibronectin type III domain-containing protein [Saprospiraceae bacterium]|nr:fibronectin type III domain-containing protein [Saprospiraceae bacterium]